MNQVDRSNLSPHRVRRRLVLTMSMVALLAGLNLTTQLTASHLPQLQFVRWRELFSLLFITPVSLALLFRIIWALEGGRADAKWLMTLFVISAALVAVAMGVHEPINALRNTASKNELSLLSDSLWFWDDLFSHVVFFAGFVGTSLTLILSQMRNPLPEPINRFSIFIVDTHGQHSTRQKHGHRRHQGSTSS